MAMREVRFEPGESPSCLTILSFDQQKFDKKGTRSYFVKHDKKESPDQENEPCMKESNITHYSLNKRVDSGSGQFCKLCSPRNRSKTGDKRGYTRSRESGDKAADIFRMKLAFKFMDGFIPPASYQWKPGTQVHRYLWGDRSPVNIKLR